ncbi:MAG: hypothetical protein Q9174_002901, partial [Haloplaca sp. 1 TL-2023]
GEGFFRSSQLSDIEEEVFQEEVTESAETTAATEQEVNQEDLLGSDTSTPKASAQQRGEDQEEVNESYFHDSTKSTVTEEGTEFEILNPTDRIWFNPELEPDESEVFNTDDTDTEGIHSKYTLSEVTKSELFAVKVTTPEVTSSEVNKSEVTDNKVIHPESTDPKITRSELIAVKLTKPKVTDSKYTLTKITKAELIAVKATEPELTNSEVTDQIVTDKKGIHPESTALEITESNPTYPTLTDTKITFPSFNNPELTHSKIMADSMGAQSPSHSPRPPSPSPLPEVHLGAQSPSASTGPGLFQAQDDGKQYDQGASRRIRPGSTSAQMKKGRRPKQPWWEIQSSFQLQEHLKDLVEEYNTDENAKDIPLTRETVMSIVNTPERADPHLWLFELCKLCHFRCNQVACAMDAAVPKCTEETCPEMRASEWQYLCASHDPPKACCAISYSYHTLEWAENQLSSVKNFPSRLTLGNPATGGVQGGLRIITNIMRRLYRVFAHAWFSHRSAFWKIERTYGAYMLYKTVCDQYSLMVQDSYTVPPEALGGPEDNAETMPEEAAKEPEKEHGKDSEVETQPGATTRRHKHTPSMGSAVTTIHEGDEDDKLGGGDAGAGGDVPPEVLESAALNASSEEVLGEGKATVAEGDKDLGAVAAGVEGLDLKGEGAGES